MRQSRGRRSTRRAVCAAMLTQLVVACSSTPAAPPMSTAELEQRLISQKTAPAGFGSYSDSSPQVSSETGATATAASPQLTPIGKLSCDSVRFGRDIATAGQAPAASASAFLTGHTERRLPWSGYEQLFSYRDNGAKQVMNDVRKLVARCVGHNVGDEDMTMHASLTNTQALGDDSLLIKIRTTSGFSRDQDALYIRIGGSVIILTEFSTVTPQDGGSPELLTLAPAAVAAFDNPSGGGREP